MILVVQGNKLSVTNNTKQMDGEKIPGDLLKWDYFGTDPNTILTYSYDILSQRSTTLYHTHPPVAAAVNKQTNYAIGSGLVFRSQPDWQTLNITKEYAKDWGMRFQKLVHYVSVLLNWYEKQSTFFRTSFIMGDSLLLFDRKYNENGLPFDLIETGGDQINFQKEGTTLGIYHDKYLRKKGIELIDGGRVDFRDKNNDQNVLQFYLKLMSRQLRGYPLAYRIISHAKNNDRWWDATLARAVLESIILGNATDSASGEDTARQAEYLANTMKGETGANSQTLTNTANAKDLNPGGIFSYREKGGIEFTDLKTPSNNFDKLQNAYIDMVGMATDTPPEVVLSKYSTSYTAHKGAFNDFIMSYMQKRKVFERNICHNVNREIAKYLFLSGLIEMPSPKFFENAVIQEATLAGNYLGPVPKHINPLQEVNAKVISKDNAFSLISDYANENGYEFDDMIEQWQAEMTEWNKMNPEKQSTVIQEDMQDKEDVNDDNNNNDDENNSDDNGGNE